jgi:hypothetical protein
VDLDKVSVPLQGKPERLSLEIMSIHVSRKRGQGDFTSFTKALKLFGYIVAVG